MRHRLFQFGAVIAFNSARYAAAARIVRHQHQIAAGQADECGQSRAFIAALVFFHLDDDLHSFFQHVLNACTAAFIVLEIGTGNFFERQKAVALHTVIDKTCFQRRFDTGNHAGIDIALALFFAKGFDVQIQQGLPIDNGHAQFFGMRGIK